MTKYFAFLTVFCFAATARGATVIQSSATNLESQIRSLESELARKMSELESCAKKTKNFQVAGGITLGLTAVGVATNVAQYNTRQSQINQAKNLGTKLGHQLVEQHSLSSEFDQGIDENRKTLAEHENVKSNLDSNGLKFHNLAGERKFNFENLTDAEIEQLDKIFEGCELNPGHCTDTELHRRIVGGKFSESDKRLIIKTLNPK
ncbi:MAG: hypothetical protein LBJ73_04570 [Rickettsiales bacterium]|jgi:hypothetical protein|nr:hypothetical protein [Rickettsiales bacterium]